MDKYHALDFLPNIVIHNTLSICGRDSRLGDSGTETCSRTLPSSWFLCGFNMGGRLGPPHEAGQAVGLCGC